MPPHPASTCAVQRLGLVDYQEAWDEQRRLVEACREDGQPRLLLLEHPPTYTFGVRGHQEHLLLSEDALASLGASVHRIDRGGDVTFHGPGQLVGYPILDLRRWQQGPLWYVRSLEATLVDALSAFGIAAHRVTGWPGVFAGDAKIAAIGVRVSRGVTSHGFALNVDPDLRYFSYIVPCGLPDVRVTSMAELLGQAPPMDHVIDAVVDAFANVFEIELRDGDRAVAQRARAPSVAL
jgi:lipoate-protein ligase B